MRTIIELPKEQVDGLAELCAREGLSRAEAIRRAVAAYLEAHHTPADETAFGIWRERDVDGRSYEDRIRGDWN